METNLLRESTNKKYDVPELFPSVEYMVEHWNSYIVPYDQKYKKAWRVHLTRDETTIFVCLRKFLNTIRKRMKLGEDSVMHNFEKYYSEHKYSLFHLADKYLKSTLKVNT